MVDRSFDNEYEDALGALHQARGECPEADALLDYAAGSLEPARSRDIETHLALCPTCEEAVALAREPVEEADDLTWKRVAQSLDRRTRPWRGRRRRWISAAAGIAAALAVVALLWPQAGQREPAPISSQTRGGIVVVAPAGPVAAVEQFRWRAVPLASTYRISVEDPDGAMWQQTTADNALEVGSAKWSEAGEYRWRVEALDEDGRPYVVSDWQAFQVVR